MKKTFLTLAAVATMLAACNNESVPLVDEMTDTPITISAGVADLTSRAGHNAGALTTGEIGFFMTTTDAANDTRYNAENRKIIYDNNGWNIEGEQLLWLNKTANVDYIAYHPYDANITNNIATVTAPTDQATNGVVDFLFVKGATTCDQSNGSISLSMNHVMTKLSVTLRAGTELGETPEFKQVVIKDIKNKATFNFEKETWNDDTSASITDIAMIQNDNLSYEAIVIPQEFKDSEFMVEITTDDARTFVFKHSDVTLEKGKAYTLNLVVGKDKVEIANGGITAEDWGTPDNWNGSLETE